MYKIMAANLEKLGYGLLKITSTGAGAATLADAGEAVGGIVLTGLATVGGAAIAVAPVALPVAAGYGLYKLFKK